MRKLKGFTLTETVFTITLLTLIWLAAAELMVASKILGSVAKHKIQAIYVAERAMEELHRKPFAQITSSTSNVSIDTRGTPDNYTDDLMGTQEVTVTSPFTHYKKVVVTVKWNDRLPLSTKEMSERLASFITSDPQTN